MKKQNIRAKQQQPDAAKGTDVWLMQARLDAVQRDLEHALRNARKWKSAAQAASEKITLMRAEAGELRLLLERSRNKLGSAETQLAMQAGHLETLPNLTRQLSKSKAMADELQGSLADRSDSLAAAGRELEQKNQQIAAANLAQAKLETALTQKSRDLRRERQKRRILVRLAAIKAEVDPVLRAFLPSRRRARARRQLHEDMRLISATGLFDAGWYVAAYPDVAKADIEPLHHFVRHGAYELRNPGPEFDSLEYHLATPELTAENMTALVHYVRKGKSEGREIFKATALKNP